MPHALNGIRNCFLVHYMPRIKRDIYVKALFDKAYKHLGLHLAH